MKKFLIIIINLVLIFLFLILCDYVVYHFENSENKPDDFKYAYKVDTRKILEDEFYKVERNLRHLKDTGFRISSEEYNPNLPSIIIFGCSFAYGYELNDNQTFAYKLQELTQRLVINRGICSWGINHMLYQLNREDIMESLKFNLANKNNKIPEVHDIIYIFMQDHIRRLYIPCCFYDSNIWTYKLDKKKKKLVSKTDFDDFYWHSYTLRSIYRSIMFKYSYKMTKRTQELLYYHFKESYDMVKKKFPNAKFTIFVYNGEDEISTIRQELENYGINIIYLSELSDKDFGQEEYVVDDCAHPSEKAWSEIAPLIVNKLNLL